MPLLREPRHEAAAEEHEGVEDDELQDEAALEREALLALPAPHEAAECPYAVVIIDTCTVKY